MKLSIENMKCQGCVSTVTETLQEFAGSKQVEVNLDEATAEVGELNDPDAAITALSGKGFPASVI